MPHSCSGFYLCKCHHFPPNIILFATLFWAIFTCHCCHPDAQLSNSYSSWGAACAPHNTFQRWAVFLKWFLLGFYKGLIPGLVEYWVIPEICVYHFLVFSKTHFFQGADVPLSFTQNSWFFLFSASVARRAHHARFCTSLWQILFRDLVLPPGNLASELTPSVFQAFMNISESQVWYCVSYFPKGLLDLVACWQMFNSQQLGAGEGVGSICWFPWHKYSNFRVLGIGKWCLCSALMKQYELSPVYLCLYPMPNHD